MMVKIKLEKVDFMGGDGRLEGMIRKRRKNRIGGMVKVG